MKPTDSNTPFVLEATLAAERERAGFLIGYLPGYAALFETKLYVYMEKLSAKYDGGMWEMYHVNNGAFFMVPTDMDTYEMSWPGNYYEGEMGGMAAGITATMFALSEVGCRANDMGIFMLYQKLWDFAATHPEYGQIRRAID